MFSKIFSFIGNKIGSLFGGGIFSTIGRYSGKYLGQFFDRNIFSEKLETYRYKNLQKDFPFSAARYGDVIPLIYGKMKVEGKIIWMDNITQNSTNNQTIHVRQFTEHIQNTITYNYYVSCAVAICAGPIEAITRMWLNGKEFSIHNYTHRLYLGKNDQPPDSLILQKHQGLCPAFRDLAYIVFEMLPLSEFNNKIPNFAFEVKNNLSSINEQFLVENLIEGVNIIPGCGEYVYDTIIQKKIGKNDTTMGDYYINKNTDNHEADSVVNFKQLQTSCPRVGWVSVVICWFATDLNISRCNIVPGVEFKDDESFSYSEEWVVGKYTRQNAHEISKDKYGIPRYGGTVNDASLIRYLCFLKQQNCKILLNPMILMDIDQKPWRGRLTGHYSDVHEFFNKDIGYNNFIQHYANLTKDYIDAFLLGSELVGLNQIHNNHKFLAVDELCNLASEVKKILGNNILVSYGADWSEYHHTEGGWYHLDKLWCSNAIDFIGINAYFPLTNSSSSNIDDRDIENGFYSGEGYDYYFDDKGNKQLLSAEYAWKNIEYWLSNKHKNPDDKYTQWIPHCKKIWFTEYGFPSIDKSTNEPNRFFDPFCIDGGLPKYSNGETNFSIQRRAISIFINYWKKKSYIQNMFLWCWDVRPSPAWPDDFIWSDRNMWERGHWINNKIGSTNLSSIIIDISSRVGLPAKKINVETINEIVQGVIFDKNITAIEAINIFRSAYFFDIISFGYEEIKFITRTSQSLPHKLHEDDLLFIKSNEICKIQEVDKSMILSKIHLTAIDSRDNYRLYHYYKTNDLHSFKSTMFVNFPIILNYEDLSKLADLILDNAQREKRIFHFVLPIYNCSFFPGSFILFHYLNKIYQIRIIALKIDHFVVHVTAIEDNRASYEMLSNNTNLISYKKAKKNIIQIFVLPYLHSNQNISLCIFASTSYSGSALYTRAHDSIYDKEWKFISKLKNNALIFNVVKYEIDDLDVNSKLISDKSRIYLQVTHTEHLSDNIYYSGFFLGYFIEFNRIHKIDNESYMIDNMIVTKNNMTYDIKHDDSKLYILNDSTNILECNANSYHQHYEYKVDDISVNKIRLYNDPYKDAQIIIRHFENIGKNYVVYYALLLPNLVQELNDILTSSIYQVKFTIILSENDNKEYVVTTNEHFFYIQSDEVSSIYQAEIKILSINNISK